MILSIQFYRNCSIIVVLTSKCCVLTCFSKTKLRKFQNACWSQPPQNSCSGISDWSSERSRNEAMRKINSCERRSMEGVGRNRTQDCERSRKLNIIFFDGGTALEVFTEFLMVSLTPE